MSDLDETKVALDALDRLLKGQLDRAESRGKHAVCDLAQSHHQGEYDGVAFARGALLGILAEHLDARRCPRCDEPVEPTQDLALCVQCDMTLSLLEK